MAAGIVACATSTTKPTTTAPCDDATTQAVVDNATPSLELELDLSELN